MRDLNNESLRLLGTQSGVAARNIGVLMDEVQTAWEGLQAATTNRKRKLKASLELQKFLSSVSQGGIFVCMERSGISFNDVITCNLVSHVFVHVSH